MGQERLSVHVIKLSVVYSLLPVPGTLDYGALRLRMDIASMSGAAVLMDVEGDARADEPLSFRESQFVALYELKGCNATETLRSLGYGGNNPSITAAKYMARPRVQRALQAKMKAHHAALEAKREVTIDRLAAEYAKLAFAEHEGPLTASHKLAALDSLGKHKGMFKPDQAVVIPVTFQFIGGPPLATDGQGTITVEHEPRPLPGPSSLAGPDKPIPR